MHFVVESAKDNAAAFDTLIWFSVLMGMASNLKTLKFTTWLGNGLSNLINTNMVGYSSTLILVIVMAIYLFTSYAFASGTAKVVALTPVIIAALIKVGLDPIVVVMSVAGITNIVN